MALWSEEEIILAMEFFYTCPERTHTDAHAVCQQVAAMLGRSPGALDRIIRNIKFVDSGGTGLEHASRLIYRLVGEYGDQVVLLRERAAAIRGQRGWAPLDCGD